MTKRNVLFLCTGNSCRSQMAEGWVNHHLGDKWNAHSAGSNPSGMVHPLAIQAMREVGIDISDHRSKSVQEFRHVPFDLVVTVCDHAAENCPIWLGKGRTIHIGFQDPAEATGPDAEKLRVFRKVRDQIRQAVLNYLQGEIEERSDGQSARNSQKEQEMPRILFTNELNQLQDDVLMLGSMVIHALKESVDALKQQDLTAAQELMDADSAINQRRYDIETRILTLIATQQPMARDLRLLAAMLELVTELERIGDYGKGIAKITILLGREPLLKPLVDIPKMRDKVTDMLRRALDAFVAQDVETARALPQEDDEVDELYNKVQRDLLEILLQKPELMDRANYLLWVAHNLERAADRVTNICERTVFTVTGELVEMDVN